MNAFNFIPVVRGENKLEVFNNGTDSEIVLIGAIGKSWYDDSGITEQEVRDAINAVPKGQKINMRVNSEGGSVKEGLGIYNAIKERRSDITAYVTGYALSIASVFPLGASKVVSPKSAIWMMHRAWSMNQGNAEDMRHAADMLDAHDETLIDIYAAETGKTKAEIRNAMEAETWIKGSDAVSFGLADESDDEELEAAAAYRPLVKAYLERCKNISPEILNAISAPTQGAVNQPKQKQQENIMNRAQMLALLSTWGVTVSDTATDTEIVALVGKGKPVAAPIAAPAAAQKDNVISRDEFEILKKQLEAANKKRIEDRVLTYVSAGKITNDDAAIYVAAAITDETATIAILDKKEVAYSNGEPISYGFGRIEIGDRLTEPSTLAVAKFEPVKRILDAHTQDTTLPNGQVLSKEQARYKALIKDWDAIYAEACRRDMRKGIAPMNANSISGFTTAFLLQGSLTPLQNVWAPLMAFSKDYSPDPYKPLATPTLKNPTAASTAQTDATNFASGNSTVGALTATMHQYTVSYQISNADLNSGLRMEDLVTINLGAFANKVIDTALVPVTAANFTATPVISTSTAFGFSDAAYLQGQLQKAPFVNLILDGAYLANLANVPTFFQQAGTVFGSANAWQGFGWTGIYKNSRWTGAGTNVKGIACNPQALIGIMGLPLTPPSIPGGIFNVETFTVPGLNISVALYMWWDVNARTMWTSYDVVAGFALGDATAGILVASGTPT